MISRTGKSEFGSFNKDIFFPLIYSFFWFLNMLTLLFSFCSLTCSLAGVWPFKRGALAINAFPRDSCTEKVAFLKMDPNFEVTFEMPWETSEAWTLAELHTAAADTRRLEELWLYLPRVPTGIREAGRSRILQKQGDVGMEMQGRLPTQTPPSDI